MTLSTGPDEVDDVADEVVEVTERYDGIVASSSVRTGEERGRASFDLRIPSANLQAALADLSDLAGAALVTLAVIVPLGTLALAVWFGLSGLRRRQRERTLDES